MRAQGFKPEFGLRFFVIVAVGFVLVMLTAKASHLQLSNSKLLSTLNP